VTNEEGDAIRSGATFERVHVDQNWVPRNQILVTRVRVEQGPAHDVLTVWSRGGNAGSLTVQRGDGATVARALLPDATIEIVK
jgi:hypothetical protein